MQARTALVMLLGALAGCGGSGPGDDAGARSDGGARDAAERDARVALDATAIDSGDSLDADVDARAVHDDGGGDSGAPDAGPPDAGPPDAGPPDAGRAVIDVRVLADPACADLSFDPPSITVPAGRGFTVNWINATGCTPIDIDKGGTVPIVIGLEPGTSYHDTVREWCGSFTGTFFFRAYYAPSFPYHLDVDCGG